MVLIGSHRSFQFVFEADVNRGCSTLRPHEGGMKRYSGSDKTGLFDF
jgi:hypothetical protein